MRIASTLQLILAATPAHALDCARLSGTQGLAFCMQPSERQGMAVASFKTAQQDNEVQVFAPANSPIENAYNALALKHLKYENLLNDEAWSGLTMSVTYASSQLLSGTVLMANGAPSMQRVNWTIKAINLLAPSGREVAISDLLNSDALEPLAAKCIAQAKDNASFKEHERELLKGRILSPASWSFTAHGATIFLPPFSLGGAVQPLYSCRFTAADLKPYINPALNLWP